MPWEYLTINDAFVNVTVQSASQSGPNPIKVWRNPGMMCPVTGNPEESLGKFNSPVSVDCWDLPVAVPTVTFGSEGVTGSMEASSEKKKSVAPELTMPVAYGFWLLCMIFLGWD